MNPAKGAESSPLEEVEDWQVMRSDGRIGGCVSHNGTVSESSEDRQTTYAQNALARGKTRRYFSIAYATAFLARYRGTIILAGELDDRWPGTRKRDGREESPDTTLREQRRAMRLVTPGDATGDGCVMESATETIPPAIRNPVIAWRKTFRTSSNGSQCW